MRQYVHLLFAQRLEEAVRNASYLFNVEISQLLVAERLEYGGRDTGERLLGKEVKGFGRECRHVGQFETGYGERAKAFDGERPTKRNASYRQ